MPLYQSGPSAPVHIRDSVVLRTEAAAGAIFPIAWANAAAADAFFRQRMSEPFTVFDSKQIFDDSSIANSAENYPLYFDNQETSGGGTSTLYSNVDASTTLSVSATTAGTRIRQTRRCFNYQPGKSQAIILTGILGNSATGITRELGLFDNNNGLFYRSNSTGVYVVQRKNTNDTAIEQDNWNIDKLDGTGKSGITLDFTKAQIFFIDFEWLGVGTVRYGFFINGIPVYCHYAHNANVNNSVYMSTPNLPIRYRINNDGTGQADSITQICVTVISEGGLQETGTERSGNITAAAAAAIQAATINSAYAICGIRLKANYLGATVRLKDFTILETGNNNFMYSIHFNPTLTTGLTWADVSNSAVQFGIGAPAGDVLTNLGNVLKSGYISRETGNITLSLNNALALGSTIAGVSDTFVLAGTPLSVNQDYYGSLSWLELL